MATSELIIAPADYDLNCVIADVSAIQKVNPQRFEWAQLTAVVHDDADAQIVVGYKDIAEAEFWCRGHMPDRPSMPRVLMCEAAAQLCSYHAQTRGLTNGKVLGFGGLDHVHFQELVEAPNRLIIAAKLIKVRQGLMVVYRFQCFVRDAMVCDGELRGIGLPGAQGAAP